MIHQDTIIVTSVLIGFGILEAVTGVYANSKRRKDDWIIDIVSVLKLAVLIKYFDVVSHRIKDIYQN